MPDENNKAKWYVKTILGILFTGLAAICSVLYTEKIVMETRIRTLEVKFGRTESFQSEVLRRLDRIERKLDGINDNSD